MNQKELTKTFMMISKWKNLGLHDLYWSIAEIEELKKALCDHPWFLNAPVVLSSLLSSKCYWIRDILTAFEMKNTLL